ncbi:hypothetical protein EDM76_01285 [bacterium]|nr:MAG: hypothetical protein EDM76_01285 [bacterium]MCL4231583.1 hypothetical protein [Dehalococcoidia bacterium]
MRIEAAIAARTSFRLGEIEVRFAGPVAVVSGPPGGDTAPVEVSLEGLREFVRADDHGRYRPLPGARTLPHGWEVRCASAGELRTAIDEVYPLALQHISQHERGDLRVVALDDVLQRQSGRYALAAGLSGKGREAACRALCSRCVRTPSWQEGTLPEEAIPCPEACSVLIALCREAALWESSPPAPSPANPTLPFAQFEAPGNEVREAYLAAHFAAPPPGPVQHRPARRR